MIKTRMMEILERAKKAKIIEKKLKTIEQQRQSNLFLPFNMDPFKMDTEPFRMPKRTTREYEDVADDDDDSYGKQKIPKEEEVTEVKKELKKELIEKLEPEIDEKARMIVKGEFKGIIFLSDLMNFDDDQSPLLDPQIVNWLPSPSNSVPQSPMGGFVAPLMSNAKARSVAIKQLRNQNYAILRNMRYPNAPALKERIHRVMTPATKAKMAAIREERKQIANASLVQQMNNPILDPDALNIAALRQKAPANRKWVDDFNIYQKVGGPIRKPTLAMESKPYVLSSRGYLSGGPTYYATVSEQGNTVMMPFKLGERKMTTALTTYVNPVMGPAKRKVLYKVGVWKTDKQ